MGLRDNFGTACKLAVKIRCSGPGITAGIRRCSGETVIQAKKNCLAVQKVKPLAVANNDQIACS